MYMRQQQGLCYSKWQGEGRRSAQGWNQSVPDHRQAWHCRGYSTPLFLNPRIAQSRVLVTHTVQDSSVSRGCDIQGGLWFCRRSPTGNASALVCHLSATEGPLRPGPSCLQQLGSHRPRDNKQVHRTGPCGRTGADVLETPEMLTA